MKQSLYLPVFASALLAQTWTPQQSAVTASLRGVSAVDDRIVWASGARGTYLLTTDGGATWSAGQVPGAGALDFRDVHGVDAQTACLLSIGEGGNSRVYKTTDGGATWTLQLTNPDANGFFDQMAFWDARHGVLMGDPVDGAFVVYTTTDGGSNWVRRKLPPARPDEGAFAASGTGITVLGTEDVWFGTGGKGGARAFHSTDGGATWSVAEVPLRNDAASAGIFSLAFAGSNGVAVGGDYAKPEESTGNAAITDDGGRTWTKPPGNPPSGFRSAAAYIEATKCWIAVGTSGSDISCDGGHTWKQFDKSSYNAISFVPSGAGWAVGARGRVARFQR